MGGVYTKSYFPNGYEAWVSESLITENNDEIMDEKTYENYVSNTNSREIIKQISEAYEKNVLAFETNMENFLLEQSQQNSEISHNRLVYDSLIANKMCQFWLTLIDQPRETIKIYFNENRPKVEDIFYEMEKKYNLEDRFPAVETINAYKQYAC